MEMKPQFAAVFTDFCTSKSNPKKQLVQLPWCLRAKARVERRAISAVKAKGSDSVHHGG